jgi:hypothetical protein
MNAEIAKQWSEKIEQQKASGKSAAAWCRENNIPYQNFLKWRKRLSIGHDLNRSSFIESIEHKDEPWMEITMHGAKCTFTKKFNRQTMSHLLEVLKGV